MGLKTIFDNGIKSSNQLEVILSAIAEGIIIIDLSKKILFQNEKALKMFGDFTGKSCYSIYHTKDTPCADCPAYLCIKEDTVKSALHTRIDDDGNLHYYELSSAPIKEDGNVVACVEIIREITERKLLEEELQRLTRRMQTVISKMKDGLLYINRRDQVAIANEMALDFFGLKLHDRLDMRVGKSDSKRKVLVKVITAFRNDDNVSFYDKNIQKDDKWYNLRFSVSRSATGKYYGSILNITDITSQKKFEELKENLTNMVVHDMKHPLNSIMYVLELAAEGLFEGNEALFKLAHKDSKILLNMIQGMLDIGKMEEGEQIISKKEFYYNKIIKNCIAEVSFLSNARGIIIKEVYLSEKVVIEADNDYLERVLVNLLANAIKFSKEGSSILVKVADYIKDGGKFIKFSVINEGPDISSHVKDTIFDKYKQAERRISGSISGTGLGLTFCKLAVESHGGDIWVTSPPEEFPSGADFSFTIPI